MTRNRKAKDTVKCNTQHANQDVFFSKAGRHSHIRNLSKMLTSKAKLERKKLLVQKIFFSHQIILNCLINPAHKSHNALEQYPTMQHLVTEMCTRVYCGILCDRLIEHKSWLIDWLINWLCDWLIDGLIDELMGLTFCYGRFKIQNDLTTEADVTNK